MHSTKTLKATNTSSPEIRCNCGQDRRVSAVYLLSMKQSNVRHNNQMSHSSFIWPIPLLVTSCRLPYRMHLGRPTTSLHDRCRRDVTQSDRHYRRKVACFCTMYNSTPRTLLRLVRLSGSVLMLQVPLQDFIVGVGTCSTTFKYND